MTAFLNQRAAGIYVETVPVSNFGKKGKAVFADGQHVQLPDIAAMNAGYHVMQSRFEAIFHTDLKHQPIMADALHDFLRIIQICAKRLFAQYRLARFQRQGQHVNMVKIRRRNDQRVGAVIAKQLFKIIGDKRRAPVI